MAEGKRWYSVTQKNKVNPTDKMLIYDGSASYVVPLSLVKGADNLTNEYVELEGEDGELYRVSVDCNGNPHAIKSSAFTASNPNVDDNTNPVYQALIVNQMYGGGELLEGTAVSHSFIELYNLSKNELNLKGLYLWYKSGTSVWESMELKGIIPPYSSYLIVGAEHNSIYKDTCRLKITEYDAVFKDVNGVPKRFSNKGMSVYISIGNAMPDTNPLRGVADISGKVELQPAYIDLMGCGGTNPSTDTVGAYEKNYRFGMNKDCACRRIDFYNGGDAKSISGDSQGKGDNAFDCEIVDYSTCEVEKFRPRSTKDGAWDMFVSKEPINENAPNTFVLGLGEDDTTRTFTWQSKPMKQGFVKYREKGETKFKQVKANTTNIQHPDVAVSRHSAIIKGFEYGKTYEYQVGAEGFWSDLAEFDVRDKKNGEIKILWQSDEQGWTDEEYRAFANVFNGMVNEWHSEEQDTDIKMSEFDFILETGDVSQNGRRRNEYFGWLDALQGYNKSKPLMTTMGNNDLLDKRHGYCWSRFFTNENQWANSVYHFMVGDVEFICLNSNTER